MCASPHIAPRAAKIAEDFARVRVLATESIATPMVEGARTRTRAKDRRGRGQRGLWPGLGSKNGFIAWEINVFSVAR